MKLTRKYLTELGIENDKADLIIEAHTETFDEIKKERDALKEDAAKIPALEEDLKKANDEIAGLKDNVEWKTKFEKEHEDFETYKTEQANKAVRHSQEKAFLDVLKDAGVSEKMLNMILDTKKADSMIAGIQFDEDGKAVGLDEIKKQVQTDYSDYIGKTVTHGANTVTPPANGGGKTKEEILAIKDSIERQKAIQENHELFGF